MLLRLLCLACATAFSLAACSGGGGSSATPAAQATGPAPPAGGTSTTPFRFIIGQPQVDYLNGVAVTNPPPTPDPGTIALLNGTKPYLLLTTLNPGNGYPASDCTGAAQIAPPGWQAIYMIRFTSEAEEEAQFAAGGVPACITWIMYDNEPNTLPPTPANELVDPPTYMLRAAYTAHLHGKLFMGTAGDSVPALRPILYSYASQFDAYDEQIQTGECPNVATYVAHMVELAADLQAYNPTITIAAGFGDAINADCTAGGAGVLTYVPPSYVAPYLAAFPSNVPAWGNFGPKLPAEGGSGTPAMYGDWSTIVRQTVNTAARTPLPIPAPTPVNTNTPIPTYAQIESER